MIFLQKNITSLIKDPLKVSYLSWDTFHGKVVRRINSNLILVKLLKLQLNLCMLKDHRLTIIFPKRFFFCNFGFCNIHNYVPVLFCIHVECGYAHVTGNIILLLIFADPSSWWVWHYSNWTMDRSLEDHKRKQTHWYLPGPVQVTIATTYMWLVLP